MKFLPSYFILRCFAGKKRFGVIGAPREGGETFIIFCENRRHLTRPRTTAPPIGKEPEWLVIFRIREKGDFFMNLFVKINRLRKL
jgi:hypothetical protein